MRVIVCGGRDYNAYNEVRFTLAGWPLYPSSEWGNLRWDLRDAAEAGRVTIVHGAARGADTLAGKAAADLGYPVEEHPADWKRHGKGAGPIRNQQMLDAGADLVMAFPGGRGTADMVRRAREAGVPVLDRSVDREDLTCPVAAPTRAGWLTATVTTAPSVPRGWC